MPWMFPTGIFSFAGVRASLCNRSITGWDGYVTQLSFEGLTESPLWGDNVSALSPAHARLDQAYHPGRRCVDTLSGGQSLIGPWLEEVYVGLITPSDLSLEDLIKDFLGPGSSLLSLTAFPQVYNYPLHPRFIPPTYLHTSLSTTENDSYGF